MDRELRELERRFDEGPDVRNAESFRRALLRGGRPVPPRVLRLTKRWKPLVEFVERWYEKPLSDDDGCSDDEIAACEKRLGAALPVALREWHRLVGKRLEGVQDSPARLEELAADSLWDSNGETRVVPIWFECQSVFVFCAPTDVKDEDPRAVLIDQGDLNCGRPGRLVATLMAMLTSDTLVGGWSKAFRGPLGEPAEKVRGGYIDGATPKKLVGKYRHIKGPVNPFYDDYPLEWRARGNSETFVRFDRGGFTEWMTATDESFRRLSPLLGVEDAVFFDLYVHYESSRLFVPRGYGRENVRHVGGTCELLVQATVDPRAEFEAVRAVLPRGVRLAAAGFHSDRLVQFTPLWPPSAKRFRPLPRGGAHGR